MIVVGEFIGQIDKLRFQRRPPPLNETLGDSAQQQRVFTRAMFEDAFARFKGKIQAVKPAIVLLKLIDHAQTLQVMFKAAVRLHADVKCILPGMAERRVAEIVRERDGLGEVFVEI